MRRYIRGGREHARIAVGGELTNEQVEALLVALQPTVERAHDDGGGTETIHLTAQVDVPRLLEDVNPARQAELEEADASVELM